MGGHPDLKNCHQLRIKYYLQKRIHLSLNSKPLPSHLNYAFLGVADTFPVIISFSLEPDQENKLLEILRTHKTPIGWTIADIKGISPLICTHKIHLEENVKPFRQPQRRLNPVMKEVVKKEILKLLDVGVIYPYCR